MLSTERVSKEVQVSGRHTGTRPLAGQRWRRYGLLVSSGLHGCLLMLLLRGVSLGPKVAPYKLPGTKAGVQTLTYFSGGNPQPHTSDASLEDKHSTKQDVRVKKDALLPAHESMPAVQADAGAGDAVKSGRGEGDINIALQKYFPYPKPDLSSMPHGTGGDVILDAVIDEHGRISSLTLLKGLSETIDQSVIATVQGWSYSPATKDGVPVSSEQELHFHYERG